MLRSNHKALAIIVASTLSLGGCKALADDPSCMQCGEIERIDRHVVNGQASPVGALAGAVIGGVVGHQVGGGRGKDVATAAGAIGGAAAASEFERRQNRTTRYEVQVELDDGRRETLTLQNISGLGIGDRVRIVNGELLPAPS